MIENLLTRGPWLSVIVWLIVYFADYYLTICGAHLYHSSAKNHFVFEGSYELTPMFQKDVDERRRISGHFLFAALVFSLAILAIWWISIDQYRRPEVFSFIWGGLFLLEAAVCIRHIRNIALFRYARGENGVHGKIEYPRRLVLTLSAIELFSFAALYLLMFLILGSWFFLGGVLTCIATGRRHWVLASRTPASPQQA